MTGLYDQREVSKILGISESQICHWDKVGLISHSCKDSGVLFFDFRALASLRGIRELLGRGIPFRTLRKAIEKYRLALPAPADVSEGISMAFNGKEIVLRSGSLSFSPVGQLIMDFTIPLPPPLRCH